MRLVSGVTLCKLWSSEYCLIISNVAFVCLTYVASSSVVKCSMSLFKAFINYGSPCSVVENMGNEEKIK
ncbi:hypothetical protein T4C_14174 [Trichinella pseudospiralis]|uniref:Uncharacterized protein n=1 Tax=Trichinella pseudospiralis TaxID=6337 RepID=A0A0V1K8U7_TRIPS|nr:hypothetical protein T4C_14174 [Trichinella pseudospiralis]